MKKGLAFLLMVLLFPCTLAHASTGNQDYLVGRDLAPGKYSAELYSTDENALIGVAVCGILRHVENSYKVETIQTDDMTLTDLCPICTIELLDGDRLMVSCSDGYAVRLTNISGTEIQDQYPGAVAGVNLTQAINATTAYIDRNRVDFDGLKDITIEYDVTLPSINITMYYTKNDKNNYMEHIPLILWKLNGECALQNPQICDPTPKTNGGVYKDITVIIGVYDETILYTENAFDTYYILPGTTKIERYR